LSLAKILVFLNHHSLFNYKPSNP